MSTAAERARSWKKIAAYYGLTLLLSSIFYALILHVGKLRGSEQLYVTGLMWSPALAAIIVQNAFGDRVADFGWGLGSLRMQGWAYFTPVLYALPIYALVWLLGYGRLDVAAFAASKAADFGWSADAPGLVLFGYVALAGTAGVILFLARTLGEEIGWRGFLVPELSKVTGFHGTAIISGLMWAAWHYPILVFGDYNTGAPAWYSLGCFTVMVIACAYVMAWLRLESGTLWTAALAHATHNRYIQTVFTPLTADTGNTNWIIDEFGIGLVIGTVIAAVLVTRHWNRKGSRT